MLAGGRMCYRDWWCSWFNFGSSRAKHNGLHLPIPSFIRCILTKCNISVHFNELQYFSSLQYNAILFIIQCSAFYGIALQFHAVGDTVQVSSYLPLIVTFCTFDYHQWGSQLNICNHPGTRLSTLSRLLVRMWATLQWRECATLSDSQFHQHCIIRFPWGSE